MWNRLKHDRQKVQCNAYGVYNSTHKLSVYAVRVQMLLKADLAEILMAKDKL